LKPNPQSHFFYDALRDVSQNREAEAIVRSILSRRHVYTFVRGIGGVGKTTVVRSIVDRLEPAFGGNVFWLSPRFGPLRDQLDAVRPTLSETSLFVIDDADAETDEIRNFIAASLPDPEKVAIVIIGRTSFGLESLRQVHLIDVGFGVEHVWPWSRGLVADEANGAFISRSENAEIGRSVERRPGLLGPDGRPISEDSSSGRVLIANAREADRMLIAKIRERPEIIYGVTPRKFEELVARIYEDLGYEVSLTPPSKDGGRDLHVAKDGPHGSFLFFVECKRYSPDRPVGVGLVRQLYGVVSSSNATAGVLVTSSSFTSGAKTYRETVPHRLTLRAYSELQGWLDQSGFTPVA
jgi:hypothetical protein